MQSRKPTKVSNPVLSKPVLDALLMHIERLGDEAVIADIEAIAPHLHGTSSAKHTLRALRNNPNRKWRTTTHRLLCDLLACWDAGTRPVKMRREGAYLFADYRFVEKKEETDAPAVEVVDTPNPDPDPPTGAIMSYSLNADGLPVMVMDGVTIRVAGTPENPLFCATDICKAVGHSDSAAAVSRHVVPDDVEPIRHFVGSSQTKADYVNERGLYSLLLGIKLPKCEPFRLWVTGKVLPSIRKTGYYSTGSFNHAAMVDLVAEVVARVVPMVQQAQQLAPARHVFDENGFEVPTWELPETDRRAGIIGLINRHVKTLGHEVSHHDCYTMLYSRFESAFGVKYPKNCKESALDWYEENGHVDALYSLAYSLFAPKKKP